MASAAIDLGLRGPVLAAADLGISGEVAAMTAIELLQANEAEGMGVVAFAEASPIIERIFDPLFFGERDQPLGEGAVSLLFEQEERARARGAHVLARILFHDHGNGRLSRLPPPGARALVVPSSAEALSLLAETEWSEPSVSPLDPGESAHEAAGACALVKAVTLLARGAAEQCLVIGQGPDRWSVFVLESLPSGAAQSESQSS